MSFYSNLFYLLVWTCVLACLIQCFCRLRRRRIEHQSQQQQQQQTTTSTTTTVEVVNASSSARQNGVQEAPDALPPLVDPKELRSNVLKVIFPEQTIDEEATLIYDPETNDYKWTSNKSGDTSCSICLENFEPGDKVVESCHSYHYACIMGWLETKDDCPNCRQKMYSEDVYRIVQQEVLALQARKRLRL